MDESLLREILEEHSQNPYGDNELKHFTHFSEWKSPKTGNVCRIQTTIKENLLLHLTAQVKGSALAKACASIMCSELEGEGITDVYKIQRDLKIWIEERVQPINWKGDLLVYQSLVDFLSEWIVRCFVGGLWNKSCPVRRALRSFNTDEKYPRNFPHLELPYEFPRP